MPFVTEAWADGQVTDPMYPEYGYLSRAGVWLVSLNLYWEKDGTGDVHALGQLRVDFNDRGGFTIEPPTEFGWSTTTAIEHVDGPVYAEANINVYSSSTVGIFFYPGKCSFTLARIGPKRWT